MMNKLLIELGNNRADFNNSSIERIPKETLLPDVSNKTTAVESITHIDTYSEKLNFDSRNIFYITDIHLDHRLKRRFPEAGTFDEIRLFIQKLVRKMVGTAYANKSEDYLLIGGDISCCFEISKIFYKELCKCWKPSNIVVILGNHEIWDCNGAQEAALNKSLEDVIEKYKLLFSELRISFLQNSLLIGKRPWRPKISRKGSSNKISYRKSEKYSLNIISEKDILSKSIEELQAMTCESDLMIFGGVGFSAYNTKFNAAHGIYKDTITSLQSDLLYTQQCELVYDKLREAFLNTRLIVLSHMPPEDWSKSNKVPNWIYVNGHTHTNYCIQSDECTVYADNQMGYKSDSILLKCFETDFDYDILRYYPDGIHHITQDQYLRFNRGKGIRCECGRQIDDIVMLKHDGMYMFLVENKKSKKFNLLNGGRTKRLEVTDLDYYYRNMIKYSEYIKSFMQKYNEALQAISDNVKKIGGDGTIHGSIVDIDFFNHIYLSPQDGTIKAYYSPRFGERYEYASIGQLLCEQLPKEFAKYKRLMGDANMNLPSSEAVYTVDTTQYKFSRIAKNLQYVTEKNIIRIWSEALVLNDNPYLEGAPKLLEE